MKTSKFKISKSIIFLLFFTLLIIVISCHEAKPDQDNGEARAEMIKHIIPLNNAVKMYHNYSEMRIAPMKDSLRKWYYDKDFNDTRTLWLDLETVKQYIAYVEEKSAENNVTPEGLQFYLSVYPNDSKKYPKKKNHQTFFIAPTTKKGEVQYGYTLDYKDGKESVLFLKDVIDKRGVEMQQNSRTDKAGFFSTALIQPNEDGLLLNRVGGTPPGGNQ